jgi:hypothetical protein
MVVPFANLNGSARAKIENIIPTTTRTLITLIAGLIALLLMEQQQRPTLEPSR